MLATPGFLLPLAASVIAQAPPAPPVQPPGAERGEEFGKTSPIALVVILLLLVATVLLIRSMSKRLRNVPASFDEPAEGAATADRTDDGTDEREPGEERRPGA